MTTPMTLEGAWNLMREPGDVLLLHDISWEDYERLDEERDRVPNPRLNYDRGVLEIVTVGKAHDQVARLLDKLLTLICIERALDVMSLGSTTFRRSSWLRAFEPDACFCFDPSEEFRSAEEWDPLAHPPPDVVFEVERSRSSLDKLPMLAHFGVPEVWRHRPGAASIVRLQDDAYDAALESFYVAGLTPAALTELLEDGLRSRIGPWSERVRAWARSTV